MIFFLFKARKWFLSWRGTRGSSTASLQSSGKRALEASSRYHHLLSLSLSLSPFPLIHHLLLLLLLLILLLFPFTCSPCRCALDAGWRPFVSRLPFSKRFFPFSFHFFFHFLFGDIFVIWFARNTTPWRYGTHVAFDRVLLDFSSFLSLFFYLSFLPVPSYLLDSIFSAPHRFVPSFTELYRNRSKVFCRLPFSDAGLFFLLFILFIFYFSVSSGLCCPRLCLVTSKMAVRGRLARKSEEHKTQTVRSSPDSHQFQVPF